MATLSKQEARTEAARKGQKRAMEGRKCPGCDRGNTLKQIKTDWALGKRCRYCGWEKIEVIS
jgi:Zn ribbon nucleic-acid-binding protein